MLSSEHVTLLGYNQAMKKNYWFKRRRYGWGWTPVTREGWIAVLIPLVIIVSAALYVLPQKPTVPTSLQVITFGLVFLSVVFMLIGVSYAKGPLPRWRWGKTERDNPDEDI